ncbi:primosomal replication protein N [Lactobacillus reuteri]|uniref:DnaD domain protein n=1 Tax=Limosilactobacillus reuteri TaxID=1598 RepID=UPI00128CCE1B|nr:DnaD domain protein [Limosilactobacillus reuteri]MQB72828.1 primosomal replication protein N [Limosilactobacillus reuteri]
MAIIRQKRKDRFLVVDNKIIEDKRLSFKARGLLIYMLSKPDDWKFWTSELVKRSAKDGISSIRTALKELETAGYLIRKRERSSKGTFTSQDWILTDKPTFQPQVEKPHVDKPQVEKPHVDNHTLPNTDFKPNTDIPNTNKLLADARHSFQGITTLWQNNWGFPNGIAQQDLTEWSKEFGNDLVYYCVEFALRHNVTARGADPYLNRKLSDYRKQGIKTVQAAIESDQRHEQQMSREYQQKSGSRKRQPINEGLPEWFKKQQEEQPNKQHYERIDDSGDPMPHD